LGWRKRGWVGGTSLQGTFSLFEETLTPNLIYPFTLDWNDWTNNLVGLSYQELTINHRLLFGKSSFV